jgi:predicted ATPase
MNFPGSRWWSFDFHNHTPASSDYFPADKGIQARDWLLAYMEAGVDCVAVTDHNCGDWIDRLRAAYQALISEVPSPPNFRPLHLFPGVELTASDGLHILAVFDVAETSAKVHAVKALAKCNDHANNAESMCTESAAAICDHIRQAGGTSILAHAEEPNGIFVGSIDPATGKFAPKNGARTVDQVLEKCDAIESHDLTIPAMLHFASKVSGKALVDGSDAHRLQKAGTRHVWVKMANPSIEGLRLAFLDPESSLIRPNGTPLSAPPKAPERRIVSASVSQLYRRRKSPLTVAFSPWFNSVIGGRGSGKSTLLEVLRIGLARDNELSQLGANSDVYRAFERFRKVSGNAESSGMLRDDTEITVDVEKNDGTVTESYRFKWRKAGLTVLRKEESGVWTDTGVTPEQATVLFPMKIFSQKQVFEVADRPSALLAYIDAAPEVEYDAWSRTHETYRTTFRELRSKERSLITEIGRKPPLENELKEVTRKTIAYQQSTVASQVKVFRENQADKKSIDDFAKRADEALLGVKESIGTENPFSLLPAISVSDTHLEKTALQQEGETVKALLVDKFTQLQQIVAAMRAAIDGFSSLPIVAAVSAKIDTSQAAYRAEVEKLSAQGVGTAQQAEVALHRKQELETELAQIGVKEAELKDVQKQLIKGFIRLKYHRRQLTKQRQKFVSEVLARVDDLKIVVDGQADVDASKDSFRKTLRLQDNTFVEDVLGEEGAGGVRGGLLGKVVSTDLTAPIHTRVTTLKQGLIDGATEILGQRVTGRLTNAVGKLTDDDHDSLLEWFPEDKVRVEYRRDAKQKFESLERASAGQKTSAILSFLLAHGDEPLLLDQPEDDLDNALVYSLVVKQIRANKSRRQIIVVTHNPNIVVNGDAELVLPMEFKSGEIHLVDSGGLQQRAVREKICAVMEGGKDAFRQRYKPILEDIEATA